MPNWIYNTITFIGSDSEIAQIKDYVKSETSDFDFNKIIPMPEELNVEDGSLGWWGMDYLLYSKSSFPPKEAKLSIERFEKLDDAKKEKALDLGRKYLENIIKFGYRTWYDWRYDHWGTKWDVCDPEFLGGSENEIYYSFYTAWAPPAKALIQLSALFPEVEIRDDVLVECSYEPYSLVCRGGDGAICDY